MVQTIGHVARTLRGQENEGDWEPDDQGDVHDGSIPQLDDPLFDL